MSYTNHPYCIPTHPAFCPPTQTPYCPRQLDYTASLNCKKEVADGPAVTYGYCPPPSYGYACKNQAGHGGAKAQGMTDYIECHTLQFCPTMDPYTCPTRVVTCYAGAQAQGGYQTYGGNCPPAPSSDYGCYPPSYTPNCNNRGGYGGAQAQTVPFLTQVGCPTRWPWC